jgi:hypothetical protein
MNPDVAAIVKCASSTQTECHGQCKWYMGKTVASNNQLEIGSPLYETNLCHTVDIFDYTTYEARS